MHIKNACSYVSAQLACLHGVIQIAPGFCTCIEDDPGRAMGLLPPTSLLFLKWQQSKTYMGNKLNYVPHNQPPSASTLQRMFNRGFCHPFLVLSPSPFPKGIIKAEVEGQNVLVGRQLQ